MVQQPDVRAVVFDVDGLMFNTEQLYVQVGTEVLRRRGHQMTLDLLDAMMGLRPHQAIARMIQWHGLEETVAEIEAESMEIFGPVLDQQLRPMTGLLSLLAALESAGKPKAVATSSRVDFVTDVLSRFDLIARFEFILTAEDVTHGKPDPEIYLTAAAKFDMSPQNLLVLEDSHNGCRAAAAAGTFVVAVPGEHSQHHDFDVADRIITSLEDPQLYDLLALAKN